MRQRQPLRTSESVFYRLRWDPALPAERVVIGYDDHKVGMREVPMLEFTPGGRIPWSRVWYLRLDDQRIWDRETRLDRVFGSGDTPPDQILDALQQRRTHHDLGEGASVRPVYAYSPAADAWLPLAADTPPEPLPEVVSVFTLNVLFDDYLPERIQSARRYAAIFELLAQADADIVALQEVQLPFLRALLAQPWAQARYRCSDGPDGDTIDPYGQLLLLKQAPQRLLQIRLSHAKRVILARLDAGSEAPPLEVCALHLTSNRRPDAAARRTEQLARLLAALEPGTDHLLVGDFNFGDEHVEPQLAPFVDAWTALHPHDPGYTYHPARNALAGVLSESGVARRLDRVLLRAPPERLLPEAVALTADAPLPDTAPVLFPSDHFGLRCTLRRGAARRSLSVAPTTHHAALAVVPPISVWGPLQAIRRAHDPSFGRWMPHLNLLYGFLPERLHAAAAEVISEALAEVAGGYLCLDRVGSFSHAGSRTLYLAPDAESTRWLAALQARLRALFPQCTEQDREGHFAPHLTVARLHPAAPEPPGLSALVPLSFPVGAVSLLARAADTPFSVGFSVPLGGEPVVVRPPPPDHDLPSALELAGGVRPPHRAAALAALRAAAQRVGHLSLLGSVRLGLDGPESDVDVLLVSHQPRRAALSALEAGLGSAGRWVDEARVPLLKLTVEGVPVDVLSAQYPPDVPLGPPEALSPEVRARLGEADLAAALGSLEAEALHAALHGADAAAWRTATRALRTWASARQVDAHALGYPGGLSWAILSAALAPRTAASAERWLEGLLEALVGWDWAQPVALGTAPPPPRAEGEAMQVWTTCAPRVNSTRNVLAATRGVLLAEWERALELAWRVREGRASWSALLAPVEPLTEAPARLEVTVTAPRGPAREAGAGWLLGNALGLLILLERVGLPLRPYARLAHGAVLRIGLPVAPEGEDRRRLTEALELFVGRAAEAGVGLEAALVWRR